MSIEKELLAAKARMEAEGFEITAPNQCKIKGCEKKSRNWDLCPGHSWAHPARKESTRAYSKTYYQRLDVKAAKREYMRNRYQNSESVRAARAEYSRTPERMEKDRIQHRSLAYKVQLRKRTLRKKIATLESENAPKIQIAVLRQQLKELET